MHVAFVTPEFLKDGGLYPGGLATYIHSACKGLMEKGVKVTVFHPSDLDASFEFQGIRVVALLCRLPLFMRPAAKLLSLFAPAAAIRLTLSWCINRRITREREGIDVIQYTNWKSIGLFRVEGPCLVRISSYEKLWDNNPAANDLDKRLCRWLEAKSIKRFGTVIGPGRHLAEIIQRDLGLPKDIRIVPTPLGDYETPSGRSFKSEGKRLVMYAGTVSRIKGAELLFETIERYLMSYSDTLFLVVGKAGTAHGRSLSDKIRFLSERHADHFLYHSNLGKADLMSAFSQADLVLIPSLIDNFPNTALEAAAHGALLMASDSASLGSLLTLGENAWILSSRSPDTWVAAIHEALALDALKADRMKENMRQRLEAHKPEKAVAALFEVYQEIMETTYRKSGEPLKKRKQ